jgi:hypothetical protein
VSVGKVSQSLVERIREQADQNGLVVWYDPEGRYREVVDEWREDDLPLERYTGSIFELRHRVEPKMAGLQPPRLVVYVPLERAATGDGLIELEAAGVVVAPGQQPATRNTRLGVVARTAFAGLGWAPDKVASLVREIDAGKLTLAELDRLAEQDGAALGVLAAIFETGNAEEVVLRFLGLSTHDGAIEAKAVLESLRGMVEAVAGVGPLAGESPAELRSAAAAQVLLSEAAERLGADFPPRLEGAATSSAKAAELARRWRNRRDLQESYVTLADNIESRFSLAEVDFPGPTMRTVDTFEVCERQLLGAARRRLIEAEPPELESLLSLVTERQAGFWGATKPVLQAQWALLGEAAELLLAAAGVGSALADGKATALRSTVEGYTGGLEGGAPWCRLDSLHRHVEQRYRTLAPVSAAERDEIERLIARARKRYEEVARTLAERFTRSLVEEGGTAAGVRLQRETFRRFVEPALAKGRTAYLLVDGLRYEMAAELAASTLHGELSCVLGTLPSITSVGMAALLPGAHQGPVLASETDGSVYLELGKDAARNRAERMKLFTDRVEGRVFATKLDALLPPSRSVSRRIEEADLIVVTATEELDGLCESGNVAMAHRLMDDVLLQIDRTIHTLFGLGIATIVVTADHGFLLTEEIDAGDKLAPPGGKKVALHRRVWIGRGGAADPSFARLDAPAVGLGGDLEIAVPWGLGVFRMAGGSESYFHGGAAPQEILLPVWVIGSEGSGADSRPSLDWLITPGSRTISARLLSVQIEARSSTLFAAEPRSVRLAVVDAGRPISQTVAASYGLEPSTGAVRLESDPADPNRLRACSVTLMLKDRPASETVRIEALDHESGERLASTPDIRVQLADL